MILKKSFMASALIMLMPAFTYSQADTWQTIVSPGALNPYHAYLSGITNCTQCHEIISGISETKCLHCHKEIRERTEMQKGYHGTLSGECLTCHTDHKKEIIKDFNHKEFDHDRALFPLAGSHRDVECGKCHLRTEERTGLERFTYLGISTACAGCHENVHASDTMSACSDCHGQESWKRTSFTHNRQSTYGLSGLHLSVACEKCHKGTVNSGKVKDFSVPGHDSCLTCHEDTHRGSLSDDCLSCHSMKGWKTLVFSHDNAKYTLKGAHKKVDCIACHNEGRFSGLGYGSCTDCHKKTSHTGVYEPCTSCHDETGWSALVKGWDNDAEIHGRFRYELSGAHKKVECAKCHVKNNASYYFRMESGSCSDCHSDAHNGQFGDKKCDDCHTVDDFKTLTFDHEKAGFRLEQLHRDIKCGLCHPEKKYRGVPVECEACHDRTTSFYRGKSEGIPMPLPSMKSRLVRCDNCHEKDKKDFSVDERTCLVCHEKPYDVFFAVWNRYVKEQIVMLTDKMDVIKDCESPLSGPEEIKKTEEEISFLEKNFHHNYRLSAGLVRSYNERLDRILSEGCR